MSKSADSSNVCFCYKNNCGKTNVNICQKLNSLRVCDQCFVHDYEDCVFYKTYYVLLILWTDRVGVM